MTWGARRAPAPAQLAGFTLLEMMVVMTLLGLLTTLVLPAMQRWHDAVQTRSRVAGIVEALQAAVFAASASRTRLVMVRESFTSPAASAASAASAEASTAASPSAASADQGSGERGLDDGRMRGEPTALKIELPAGWRVERVATAEFLPNGLCKPGFAALRTERGVPVVVAVEGPVCAVRMSESEPGAT